MLLSAQMDPPDWADEICPFEDYTSCYTGFVNRKGDTLWPAQFEQYNNNGYSSEHKKAWIVTRQDKVGVIDWKGKLLIPFDYKETLSYIHHI